MKNDNRVRDAIDHRLYPVAEGSFLSEMDTRLHHLLRQSHPDLQDGDFISYKQLTPYRMQLLEEIIDQANCKNEFIREAVHGVANDENYAALDIQDQLDKKITFGQKIADDVARFGGSWTFIISFIVFMVVWMLINIIQPFGIAFDKYPFILLNLALSTIAAIQAPLIMMSQNRASDYDRLQAKKTTMLTRCLKKKSDFCTKNWTTWCNKTSQIYWKFKNCKPKCWPQSPIR